MESMREGVSSVMEMGWGEWVQSCLEVWSGHGVTTITLHTNMFRE